ncbi:hypothetical protein B6N58_11945 [Legionella micdadei]|nr:hypothetical protein B6N58_11945 [Legionella micdadei]
MFILIYESLIKILEVKTISVNQKISIMDKSKYNSLVIKRNILKINLIETLTLNGVTCMNKFADDSDRMDAAGRRRTELDWVFTDV